MREAPCPDELSLAPVFLRRRAAEESADPGLLQQLACDESYWVRRQAARNPALPSETLGLLQRAGATRDLRGFATPDPTLPPEEIESLLPRGKFSVQLAARHPSTPPRALAWLAGESRGSVRLAVASHPKAPETALGRLCSDLEVSVRVAAASHPTRPDGAIALLRRGGASADLRFAGWPSREPSHAALLALWESGPWGRFLAARRPACPQRLLERAGQDDDWQVRAGLLENADVSDALLERYWVQDEYDPTQLREIGKRRPSRAVTLRILGHPNPEVRLALARHPRLPRTVLGILASDDHEGVRAHAALHPRTPPREIERLVRAGGARDLSALRGDVASQSFHELAALCRRGPFARMLAARHPGTPHRLLACLLCDASPQIRQWALVHPNRPREIVRDLVRCGSGDDLQGFHEADPEIAPETLVRLAKLGAWARRLVALHPRTPRQVLERLIHVDEWEVRRNVAMRPGLPDALRRELAGDRAPAVRRAAEHAPRGHRFLPPPPDAARDSSFVYE